MTKLNLSSFWHPSLTIFLTLAFPTLAWAGDHARCADLVISIPSVEAAHLKYESALELEIDASDSVLALMTTTDGTLRPLWPEGKPLEGFVPADLLADLSRAYGADPLAAEWELLRPQEQREIIMAAARARNKDFHDDRRVPGLRYRDQITLHLPRMMKIAGRLHARGALTLPFRAIFGETDIEFMGPNRMKHDLGFELHVRSDAPVGENFLTGHNLARILIGVTTQPHVHIVGPYPDAPGPISGLRMVGFHQHARIAHDLIMMERGVPLANVSSGVAADTSLGEAESAGFYVYNPYKTEKFFKSIKDIENWSDIEATRAKEGTVGLRTHQLYDKLVWGIESRYLSTDVDEGRLYTLLNILQEEMVSGRYFHTEDEALAYAEYRGWDVRSESPRAGWQGVWQNVRKALWPFGKSRRANAWSLENTIYLSHLSDSARFRSMSAADKQFFLDLMKKNDLINYLFIDWTMNFATWNETPAFLAQIAVVQEECMRYLKAGMSSEQTMELFARKSGLRYRFARDFPQVFY